MAVASDRTRALLREMYRHRAYYLIILPAIVCFIVVKYIPIGGIVLAFKNYTITGGIWGSEWAGFKYFERMLGSADFLRVFRNTIVISLLKMATVFPAPIVFALMLNEVFNLRLKKTFQTISYLPHFISWVVAAGLFRSFLSFEGPVNYLLELFTDQRVVFMKDPFFFMMVVVTSGVWKTVGWGSIIYLAAIAGIDPELYDAAEIDGAGRMQRIVHITLPAILPVIVVLFLLRIGEIFDAGFDQIFNLYSPIVYSVGDIIDTYVYRQGLVNLQFSYTTAVGLSKNILGLIMLLIMNYVVKRLGARGTVL
ncbi:MAG: ABC transporter permease subunit [Spirochaetaceae bacterium]|nr:ABC transporter permease subunit [Spirochaetaceae bacterium]